MLRIGAPSGTRTGRVGRLAYRPTTKPQWGFVSPRESPEQSAPKYSLTENVRLFFYCNFPGCCGSVHHRGREQPAPRVLRTAGQKRPGGAFLGRGRVPGEMNGRYRLTGEVRLFFCCNFPGCCGSVHHRGREQGVSVALRTDRQQSPSGALLARGRFPGEMCGGCGLAEEGQFK